jgi:aldehyde dehydrogenase (NAD+)
MKARSIMSDNRVLFDRQKEYFLTNVTKSRAWRMDQLDRVERLLNENESALRDALAKDFKTAWFEQSMEYYATLGSIADTKEQLAQWMAPEEAPLSKRLLETGHKGIIFREPYGVCLIIAPFNAPIALSLDPLITALSAGNTAILKLSEAASHVAALFQELIGRYFEPEAVAIASGGRSTVTELLSLPLDFIFFTGSTNVGKVVMRAAAEHLTPVLLELGGQNPVVVDATANLRDSAEKIVWGKMAFGGQWCVSPGYVYVHRTVAEDFVEACKAAIVKLYGSDPKNSPDFSRIISEQDVDRLAAMLAGSPVAAGGSYNREERHFEPTIVYPANWSAPIMETEIFGPILPIMTYTDLDAVLEVVKRKPHSLAAYIFSADQRSIDRFVHGFSFGGGAVNQTVVQCFINSMPFGGVGASGMGHYYGKYGFDSLSHAKSILVSPIEIHIDAVLPPYTKEKAVELGEWFAP